MNIRNSIAVALGAATISAALLASSVHAQTAPPSIKANITMPARSIYALTSDNSIYVLRPAATQYARLGRVDNLQGGNLVGIDFRPADNNPNVMYGLTDTNQLYQITLNTSPLQAKLVSTMTVPFTGGLANVMDFNPVANALRVMGSNDQNLAVVNGTDGSSLSTTVAQTKFAYAQGDVNFGQDPEITGGAYTNNFAGATSTIFYMVDAAKDTLVTIATKTATGSSNTGGGQLQTIGSFVDGSGNLLNMSPTTDIDIYTDSTGKNFIIGQTTRLLFSIDLSQINPSLPLGQTQKIVVKRGVPGVQLQLNDPSISGGMFDIAMPTRASQ